MSDTASPRAIEMRGIVKRFAGVVANDDVEFDARFGEVHALIGENGAGKSTLMSILAGIYRPDEGTVAIGGAPVQLRTPRDAIAHGIGMVFQHFMLVEPFTVAENMLLGREDQPFVLDTAAVEREIAELGRRFSLEVDPKARIWQLSVGEQQRVEILRALHRGARILVLDEPTAVLTPQEAEGLIATLRGMAAQGFCIVFISHKLDEVLAVADRVTVLRRGKTVATVAAGETDRAALARLMVGRDLAEFVIEEGGASEPEPVSVPEATGVALELRDVSALGDKGLPGLIDVNLSIAPGEILGIAGVAGNGQRELAEAINGLRRVTSGAVIVDGREMTNRATAEIAATGVAHVPEDRLAEGLIPEMNISENSILREYREKPIVRGTFLMPRAIARFTDRLIRDYDVKAPGRKARLRLLSGGNQQKLLIARELSGSPKVIVAVHPSRGVDVGAIETIHAISASSGRGARRCC
jgi:simple sugar transport system ATP-binding protein